MTKRTHLQSNQAKCVSLTTRSKKLKKMEMRVLSPNLKHNKVWSLNKEPSSRCSSTLKPTRLDKLPMLLISTQDSI